MASINKSFNWNLTLIFTGGFCDCVIARRGVDNQTLFLKSNIDTITKDLASFLCIAVGFRKSCGEGSEGFVTVIFAMILIAARAGIYWAGGTFDA